MKMTQLQLNEYQLMLRAQPCVCSNTGVYPECQKCIHSKPHRWNRQFCDHFCRSVMAFCVPDNTCIIIEGEVAL